MLPLRTCVIFSRRGFESHKHIYDSASLFFPATDTLGISKVWFYTIFYYSEFQKNPLPEPSWEEQVLFTEHERVGAGRPLEGA